MRYSGWGWWWLCSDAVGYNPFSKWSLELSNFHHPYTAEGLAALRNRMPLVRIF